MYDRILVPTDGSPEGASAVAEALEFAALTGGSLVALYVVDTRDYTTLPESKWTRLESELESAGQRAVDVVAERATAAGVDAETAVERGVPHEVILRYATEHDVDAIVMATHGRSGVQRFLLGSVTERVVRQSPVPVLVVRVEHDGETDTDAQADVDANTDADVDGETQVDADANADEGAEEE